ncbi:MAG: hypothetical protein M1401_20710 [Chloroflexi bacterium]|nr:hypothetical protein [Chloroflexota bacterium]
MARNDDNTGTLALLGLAGLVYWLWKTGKLGGTTPPPGEQCPTGQHWDATASACVADDGDGTTPPSGTYTLGNGGQISNIDGGMGHKLVPLPTITPWAGFRFQCQLQLDYVGPMTPLVVYVRVDDTAIDEHSTRVLPETLPPPNRQYWLLQAGPLSAYSPSGVVSGNANTVRAIVVDPNNANAIIFERVLGTVVW